jgi:Gas vesicle synthesis protein GvpL/GvpF
LASYVYGIVEDAVDPPAGEGIAGAPLRVVLSEGAAALVSELPPGEELEFGRDALLVHAAVLERALDEGTVLPMRFGMVLNGSEAVRDELLEPHAEELRGQLVDMAGKVEIRIRAIYDETQLMREVVQENPQIARMREAIKGQPEGATHFTRINLGELVAGAVEDKRQIDGRAIVDALGPHAAAIHVDEPAHERVVVRASFLVERRKRKPFEDAVERVAAAEAGRMTVTFTDPLPPHSFVHFSGSE